MFKTMILISLCIFLLSSCSGLLWTGQTDDINHLTITITNPFIQNGKSLSSKALAYNGKYLYIELAKINNKSAFNADVSKPLNGDGVWKDMEWGGHAILTFNLADMNPLIAIFKEIPRGQDLLVRVFLDSNQLNFESNVNLYNGVDKYPIVQSYNALGSNYDENTWVTIRASDLDENIVNIPLRPIVFGYQSVFDGVEILTTIDNYIDPSGILTNYSEPSPGSTKFTQLELDFSVSGNYLVDAAVYQLVESNLATSLSLPGMNILYNNGVPSSEIGGNPFSANPSFPYRHFSLAFPAIDSNYFSNEIFIGSTVFSGPELTYDNTEYGGTDSYNVSYGLLYDNFVSAYSDNGINITWSLPQGFLPGDFLFQIIHINSTDVGVDFTAIDTIEEIYAFQRDLTTDFIYYNPLDYLDIGFSTSYGSWVIILAKIPDGTPFIYGRAVTGTQG